MNFIDLLIIILIGFFAIEGLGKNFFTETLDFISFLFALFFSLRFYNFGAEAYTTYFQVPHSIANVLGFISIWFLIETILIFLTRVILNQVPMSKEIKPLHYFSVFPAFAKGVVFVAIILVLVASFPIQPRVKKAVDQSRIGSLILSQTQGLETPLKRVFGGITQDTLTFLTIKPQEDEKINLGFQTHEFKPNPQLEQQMINLVNKERTSRGLKTLTFDAILRDIGRKHSGDMFERGYFSHYSPEGKNVADRAEEADYGYLVIGENLAYAPTLDLAHNGLMNSPGHRANILSPDFGKIGIGIMDGEEYGLMVTQVFSN